MQLDKLPSELLQLIGSFMPLSQQIMFGGTSAAIHNIVITDDVKEKFNNIMQFKHIPNRGLHIAFELKDKVFAGYFMILGAQYPVDTIATKCVHKYYRGRYAGQTCTDVPIPGHIKCPKHECTRDIEERHNKALEYLFTLD